MFHQFVTCHHAFLQGTFLFVFFFCFVLCYISSFFGIRFSGLPFFLHGKRRISAFPISLVSKQSCRPIDWSPAGIWTLQNDIWLFFFFFIHLEWDKDHQAEKRSMCTSDQAGKVFCWLRKIKLIFVSTLGNLPLSMIKKRDTRLVSGQ